MKRLALLVIWLALIGAYALMGATAAKASAGLTVGIAGNTFLDAPAQAKRSAEGLNLDGVRVFIHWHGERHVSEDDWNRLEHIVGLRALVTVYGLAEDVPATAPERGVYAAYVAELVAMYRPWAVSVWNEPNLWNFWPQDRQAAEKYERLLARTYDAVKAVDRAVKVLGGETIRSYNVEGFIRRMARRYRMSGRWKRRPLMDGFAHHPYPQDAGAPVSNATQGESLWLVQGDVERMRVALADGFRGTKQKRWTPIYWTETGWSTVGPDWIGPVTPQAQGERMAEATELAYCQRNVRGIFFFLLWDDPSNGQGTWQSGVIDSDLERKPSYRALANAIANVTDGNVDCSRFPEGSL